MTCDECKQTDISYKAMEVNGVPMVLCIRCANKYQEKESGGFVIFE
jgi:hypothetical protein